MYLCVSVFLYLCISCLSVCICICIWGVFVYLLHLQASPAAHSPPLLTSRHLPAKLTAVRWQFVPYNQLSSAAKVIFGLVFEFAPCISVLKWNYHEWNYFKKKLIFLETSDKKLIFIWKIRNKFCFRGDLIWRQEGY